MTYRSHTTVDIIYCPMCECNHENNSLCQVPDPMEDCEDMG